MTGYLLDTSVCVDVIRVRVPELTRRFSASSGRLHVSSITVEELTYGAIRSDRPIIQMSRNAQFLALVTVLNFDVDAAAQAGAVRAELSGLGQRIGSLDMLIAGHARSAGLVLVTSDAGFGRISELQRENWRGEPRI